MIKNYFITAFRNIWRNKTFSLINVLGLAIGISAALVIFLIVHYEFSYDTFEKDKDRIYRVVLDARFNGFEGHSTGVQAPLSAAVANEMSGIELTVPVMTFQGDGSVKVSVARDNANPVVYKKQPYIVFTNPQYFQLLQYNWLAGSRQTSLRDPFSVVLSESRATAYFPNTALVDIIGKEIIYNENLPLKVTGIVKDPGEPTHFTGLEFISFSTIAKTNLRHNFMMDVWNDWMAYSFLYVKLAKDATVASAETQLKSILTKYNKDANKDANNTLAFRLQPLSDIHFNAIYQGFGNRVASKSTLYGLLAIAAFLLVLGCINFINLTTAQATRRAKEIGVRKTMGSSKTQLILQFLGETFAITLIATIFSVALTPLLLNMFKGFIPEGLHFDLTHQPAIIVFLLLLLVTVSFLSGLYPALVLSKYKPVSVLKNQPFSGKSQTGSAWVRKTLTVSQFVIAQFLVIATLIVARQISYSIHADLGFNKDAVITFQQPRDTVKTHGPQLLEKIKSIPGVAMASTGFMAPADEGVAFTNISYFNGSEEIQPGANIQIRWGDTSFIHVYQIPLLAGRNIVTGDTSREFIVNEKFAKAIGFKRPQDAIGKQLLWNKKYSSIVGIIKDFHDISMKGEINPLVLAGGHGSTFHIRLQPNTGDGQWKKTIGQIQSAFTRVYPDEDFNYSFVDDKIARFYTAEQHTQSLLTWATALAVFISCLGLLGLVIYTTNVRTKEIGIRKILGASVSNIVTILSREFVQLVLLAFVIAAPLAWWAMYKWLQNYVYKATLSWWVFASAGAAMLLIAVLTLSFQTIRTAVSNPVKNLRTE
jgi:putative ABC transport system permease protein